MRNWLDAVNVAALCALWTETLVAIVRLPATIATSFSAAGVPQAFGSKYTLLLMPAIGSIVVAIVWIASTRPIRVTGVTFAAQRYGEAQEAGRFFLRIVRAVIILGLTVIQYTVIESARDGRLGYGFGIAVASFAIALLVSVAVMIVRLSAFGER